VNRSIKKIYYKVLTYT